VLPIEIVHLDPELPLPAYAHQGDAGLDLVAREDAVIPRSGGRALVPTGIAIAVPIGYVGYVMPRSGLALTYGVTVLNAPGVIDAGYRGEIKVVLLNTDQHDSYQVHRGDRIAQLVVAPVEQVRWELVEGFDGEHRGGGFGHSGR
jgi:dUTP pyrophosphatase